MIKRIFGLDIGKAYSKRCVLDTNTLTLGNEICLPTAIGSVRDGNVDIIPNTTIFSVKTSDFCKKGIIIGSNSLPEKSSDSYSKAELVHQVLALYCIAEAAEPDEVLGAIVGSPASIYLDKKMRMEYLKMVLPNGKVQCTINGEKKNFFIEKKKVFAEAVSAIYASDSITLERALGVVDLGSRTMDIAQVIESEIKPSLCHTSPLGARSLIATVSRLLVDNMIFIDDSQIIPAIIQGYIENRDEFKKELSAKLINIGISEYIDELEKELSRSWKNLDTLKLHFVGGTSFLIRKQLLDRFENAIISDSYDDLRFQNARGFAIYMANSLMK